MVNHGFGSNAFAAAFTGTCPEYDAKVLRAEALKATQALLDSMSTESPVGTVGATVMAPRSWVEDPVRTVVDHETVDIDAAGTQRVATIDAFGRENGLAIHCSEEQMTALIQRFTDPKFGEGLPKDLRSVVRDLDAKFVSEYAGVIIANQAIDFQKQDGVTEIEEAIEANPCDYKMSDDLLADEANGVIVINRSPSFIGCVSNFSNFLDLFRKTLRLVEVGVPAIILSRSNTTQHHFRWFQLLDKYFAEHKVDKRMVCFVSADIVQQRRLMSALAGSSALYFTGSRFVAEKIKDVLPRLMASTGGPNTMIAASGLTPSVRQAVQWSVGIENSGQCTAMRHLIAPSVTNADVESLIGGDVFTHIETPAEALSSGAFAMVFKHWASSFERDLQRAQREQSAAYTRPHETSPIAYKVEASDNLPYGIEENWRRLFLDVTCPGDEATVRSEAFLEKVAKWLTVEQPIVLAINGDSSSAGYPLTKFLFEHTAQVVYSVGETEEDIADGTGSACLTCQARPQDAECFGEFPPRKQLSKYTRFPVTVPSSTAGYNSDYSTGYLQKQAAVHSEGATAALMNACVSNTTKGYVRTLVDFLHEATSSNPRIAPKHKRGPHRTSMWGIQRPPFFAAPNVLRAESDSTVDEAVVYLTPFAVTNARTQILLSIDPSCKAKAALEALAAAIGVPCHVENSAAFDARTEDAWNVIELAKLDTAFGTKEFPLAGNFCSLVFPLGHIKSTKRDDQGFIAALSSSEKWLKFAH